MTAHGVRRAKAALSSGCKSHPEPIFEADFEDNAYGYRPARGAVDAVKEASCASSRCG
jgi:retron-type reverse transcriptase